MIRATATFRPRSDLGRFVEVKITPAVRQSIETACGMIQERAKELCPVDTGALRDSIEVATEDLDKTIRGSVGPGMPYASYVEFGTGVAGAASAGAGPYPYNPNWPGMPAQPYMRPAFDEVRPQVEDIFRSNIGAAIEL
jgi:HK97 gp10 family phage protein